MADIAYVAGATTDPAPFVTSYTISVPTGTLDGDVMIASVQCEDVRSFTDPSGWTLIGEKVFATHNKVRTLYRVASSEPANYVWTIDGAGSFGGGIIDTFSGVDNATPMDATAVNNTGTTQTIATPAITTVTDKAWAYSLIGSVDTAVAPTAPTNMTLRSSHSAVTTAGSASALVTPAGLFTPNTWDIGTPMNTVGWTIALRPAVAAVASDGDVPTITYPTSLFEGPWLADMPLAQVYGDTVLASGVFYEITVNDTLALADAIVLEFQKVFADAAAVADALALEFQKVIDDTLALADSIATERGQNATINDSVTLTDTQAIDFQKVIADSAALADTLAIEFQKVLTETLGLTDATALVVQLVLSDSVTLADSVTTERGIEVTINDTLGGGAGVPTPLKMVYLIESGRWAVRLGTAGATYKEL